METFKCVYCGRESKSKGGTTFHQDRCPKGPSPIPKSKKWRRAMRARRGKGTNQHTKHGDAWIVSDATREKMRNARLGRKLSEEHKKNVSAGMKKAHAEGRAWNIGMSRWNNEPSWPERFFMQVIDNEFLDKEYEREYSVSIYSCDFAWPHKKKCIEIDGEQHQRWPDVIERDKRKDATLLTEGWDIMRIRFKDLIADTKTWIEAANIFIGE